MSKRIAVSSSIQVYTHLRKLLASIGVPKRNIRVGAHLLHDLKLSSQCQLEWIHSVEKHFDIEIDNNDQKGIRKVSDMIDFIVDDV